MSNTVHADSHPRDLLHQLRHRFGFEEFRHGQRDVIDAVLEGRDVLAVMPTGQGKSLCFQLPATLTTGLTVVVSPLIALMKDQVDGLRAKGIAASAYHSGLSESDRDRVIQDLRLGKLRLLYLAPERLQHAWFIREIRKAMPSLLVVDEAHCISHWGHDFRPDYLKLAELRRQLDAPACLALTATATMLVQSDICDRLELREPLRVVTGFRRPNLRFAVEPCSTKTDKLTAINNRLARMPAGVAIIYCSTRRHVEDVASELRRIEPRVSYYHAGLDDELRATVQQKFREGAFRILVATNAFGMGIDKPDVRLVLHYDVPGSVDAYYQEAGRAGRDGAPADCVLLFQHGDVATQEFFIQKLGTEPAAALDPQTLRERQEACRERLRQMVGYVYSTSCRQLAFLDYFGDVDERALGMCGQCDRCLSGPSRTERDDETVRRARAVLATVRRYDGRFGATRITDILYGTTSRAVVGLGLQHSASFGQLKAVGRTGISLLIKRLVASGAIRVEGLEFPVLALTTKGIDVLTSAAPLTWEGNLAQEDPGTGKAAVESPAAAQPHIAGPLHGEDLEVFERLRRLRSALASEEGVAAFRIFHDKTLRHLAATRPASLSALETVPGIGPAKLERYGKKLLEAIQSD